MIQLSFELVPQFRPHPMDRYVDNFERSKKCKTAKEKLLRDIRREQLERKQ